MRGDGQNFNKAAKSKEPGATAASFRDLGQRTGVERSIASPQSSSFIFLDFLQLFLLFALRHCILAFPSCIFPPHAASSTFSQQKPAWDMSIRFLLAVSKREDFNWAA